MQKNFKRGKDGKIDLSGAIWYYEFLMVFYETEGGVDLLRDYYREIVCNYFRKKGWKLPSIQQLMSGNIVRNLMVFHYGPQILDFQEFKHLKNWENDDCR